jgi:hypothetical protein
MPGRAYGLDLGRTTLEAHPFMCLEKSLAAHVRRQQGRTDVEPSGALGPQSIFGFTALKATILLFGPHLAK